MRNQKKRSADPHFRRDLAKLIFLIAALAGTLGVFILTPSLSSPTLLALVATVLLSPLVSALERKGLTRTLSISIIFLVLSIAFVSIGVWVFQAGLSEWNLLKENAPQQFHSALEKLNHFETELKGRYPFLESYHPTQAFLEWGQETGKAVLSQSPSVMGTLIAWFFLIPPITFVMLEEGRSIRRRFFALVPNRYFESIFVITSEILDAISDYVQAKLVEAILVGILVGIGLLIIGCPYVLVLGVVAGIANIVPYVGPLLGLAPALFVAVFDNLHPGLVPGVLIVHVVANVIDTFVIFPVVVAKLINLHPLIIIAVVAVGQQYYGLIGMLVSIPIAASIKVVMQQIYIAVYENRPIPSEAEIQPNDGSEFA